MQAFLPPSAALRQCLDTTGGKIENRLERGFVKHRPNYLLIHDAKTLREKKPKTLRGKNLHCG